jgi:Holliday junction resolvase RusA-like endonuclease
MIKLTIPGKPMGKQRAKVYNGHGVTPEKTVNYETLIKQLYIVQYFRVQLHGPLSMNITAYFQIPASASKTKRADMESGKIRPTCKPDWDNIGKIISDALNGLAYGDDSYIVGGTVCKWYSQDPRVEIEIQEV